MAKIKLICEQCGGNIILDNTHEIGTCENCYSQFVIKQDQIIQKITQNITKHVYGYEGKDIDELLSDGYKLLDLGDDNKANGKFKNVIDIDPNCWDGWFGFALTGGDNNGYLSIIPAYRKAYRLAVNEEQETKTFVSMTYYLPDSSVRSALVRTYNLSSENERSNIFNLVSEVIGCDESEIARLAVDLCPDDWRAYFALAKFRKIRAKWSEPKGGFFSKKRLPAPAQEVADIFIKSYTLASNESENAKNTVMKYIDNLSEEKPYHAFCCELKKMI